MHSSDGVVPYSSSHLAGAESEKIVAAGHLVFSNDAAVIEIKRILGENLTGKQYKLEIHYQPVIPAGKALPTNSHPRGSLRVRVKIEGR